MRTSRDCLHSVDSGRGRRFVGRPLRRGDNYGVNVEGRVIKLPSDQNKWHGPSDR